MSNVKMKLPEDVKGFSIRGMELEVAKDNTVMVPEDSVVEASAHGLTIAPEDEEEKSSGKKGGK